MEPRQGNTTLAASGDKVEIDVLGLDTLAIQVVGAMSATLLFEGTINGKDWFALNARPFAGGDPVTSATAAGVWFANVSACISARVRCSAWVSGTPTIAVQAIKGGTTTPAGATATLSNPPQASAAVSYTRFQNLGADITKNIKATTGNVKAIMCHNLNGADRYFQLHNTATVPGGAAVPALTFLVPAGGLLLIGDEFFGEYGHNFDTGIAFAFSTTEATYTAGVATDQVTQVMYK